MTEFLRNIEELFDIFCNDQKQRRKLEEINKLKVNKDDFAFYEDQIGPRKRKCLDVVKLIDQSDINFLQKMSKKLSNSNNTVSTSSANIIIVLGFASNTSTSENSEISVSFDSALPCSSKSILQQNRVMLKELAMVCERYKVFDRAGAAIASATLKAFGIVTEEDKRYVVDRSKLWRERPKYREEIKNKEQEFIELVDSIFVDGRKDAAMAMVDVNGNYHRQTVIEEHCVIVGEPNGFYLSHVMPEDGTGYKIATSVYSAIKDTALEQKLKIVGSDGTAVMTGKSKGFIALLETLIGRPLQWVICLLHLNELPLRHVFQNLDGVTSRPDSFSGPIGRQLNGAVSEWKVVKFKSIPNPKFPVISKSLMDDLSSDQYYAYRICSAVILGSVDANLEFLGRVQPFTLVNTWMSYSSILCCSRKVDIQFKHFGIIFN